MSESYYGFAITYTGRRLMLKAIAGDTLELTRIMVGSGKLEGADPRDLTDLIAPVAQATSTGPKVDDNVVSFIVEYRSDLNGGLDTAFWLNEFGIYALDPESGEEVLLYYATLGGYPQYVAPYTGGTVDIRRFPVSIVLTDELEVTIAYPPLAFMTYEDTEVYVMETALPVILDEAQKLIDIHNASPEAHPDLRVTDSNHDGRIKRLEDMLINDVTGNPYLITFGDMSGVIVEGVWNRTLARIEF